MPAVRLRVKRHELKWLSIAGFEGRMQGVAAFENEPANANIFLAEFPYTSSFLLLTQHSPNAPKLDEGVIRIADFLR